MRDPSGVHLNAAGRALARRVAAGLPRFDRVVTSPRPRAVESAEALGLSVDAELPSLAEMPDDAAIPLDGLHPRTFEDYVELVERSPAVGAYARGQSERWRVELERVPDGGLLLLISHGGVIEFGAASALPRRARSWGPPLGYLEGVRLAWDGRRWASGEVLRVPA
ncbi:MAG: histidine phosphatase family protein [Thermoplasmata archaeon]